MKQLIKEYKQSLKHIRKLKEIAPEYEQKIYSGMLSDLEYAIEWMNSGRRPGQIKGVYGETNRLSVWDPDWFSYQARNSAFAIPLDAFEEVEERIDFERSTSTNAKRRRTFS